VTRIVAALAMLALVAACGSDTGDTAPPATTAAPTLAPPPTTPPPTTTAPTPTSMPPEAPPGQLLVVGDSIAGQLYWALDQRSRVRGGPEVRYLLTAGPAFSQDWPEPLPDFVTDPADTAVIVSFGVWHASPPEPVAHLVDGASAGHDDTVAFLGPIAELGTWRAEVHLLADIDDPEADARIQQVNADISRAATEVGLPVHHLLSGGDGDQPARVHVGDVSLPVRNGADATHFCAAAALVMADQMLDDLRVPASAVTLADLDDLLDATRDTSYFTADGCS